MGASVNGSYADQDYGYNFSKSVTGAGDFYGALRSMLPWTVPYDANGDYIRLPMVISTSSIPFVNWITILTSVVRSVPMPACILR